MVATAFVLHKTSNTEGSSLYHGMALTWWVAYLGLLGPREMWSLTREVLIFSSDFGDTVDRWMTCVIKNQKTKRAFGFTQHVLVRERQLFSALEMFFTLRLRRNDFSVALKTNLLNYYATPLVLLRLPSETFTLGSIRAGGPLVSFRKEAT